MDRFMKLFDVSTHTGQFCALLVLWLITFFARWHGQMWAEKMNDMILGAILTLVNREATKGHQTNVAEAGSKQTNIVKTEEIPTPPVVEKPKEKP